MMTKWAGSGYGLQNGDDMWGLIGNQVAQGWFVPSKEEWSAFAEELGIDYSNYQNFGLSGDYWSSSQYDSISAWYALFGYGYMEDTYVSHFRSVRLSATF